MEKNKEHVSHTSAKALKNTSTLAVLCNACCPGTDFKFSCFYQHRSLCEN